mmetsp:Transcript_11228/g.27453  ORF Transcript_11228/g.27453 Transcript_11228/m.27453 type:complete len:122 (+) Transcript_11228:3829-4194(+)
MTRKIYEDNAHHNSRTESGSGQPPATTGYEVESNYYSTKNSSSEQVVAAASNKINFYKPTTRVGVDYFPEPKGMTANGGTRTLAGAQPPPTQPAAGGLNIPSKESVQMGLSKATRAAQGSR